jgi:antibiotic biosynthesis monooxygenase (ABM) superfamily enzyme
MTLVFIRHNIEDYPQWKNAFDGFMEKRHAGGERSFRIAHAVGEKNDLCLVFEWDNAANAKRFLDSPELAAAMKRAGVVGKPEMVIAEELASGRT